MCLCVNADACLPQCTRGEWKLCETALSFHLVLNTQATGLEGQVTSPANPSHSSCRFVF